MNTCILLALVKYFIIFEQAWAPVNINAFRYVYLVYFITLYSLHGNYL